MADKTNKSGHIVGRFVTRKSGNSVSLTVPAETGVEPGREFILVVQNDGSLLYVPQHVNPWRTSAAQDYDFRTDLKKMENIFDEDRVGKEL